MARNMDYREENRRLQREINYRVIGEHMREVRHKCGMTQKVLASVWVWIPITMARWKQEQTGSAFRALFSL